MPEGIEIEGMVFDALSASPEDHRSRVSSVELVEEDLAIDRSLRPKMLDDYLGQTKVKESLKILIEAAKKRG